MVAILHGDQFIDRERGKRMKKRYEISVREKGTFCDYKFVPGKEIKKIKRVLYSEQIGNFNPIFCRYNNNPRCLVKSEQGDLSDPFRREESYAETFYIEV